MYKIYIGFFMKWKIEPHFHPDIYQVFLMETGSLTLQTSNKKQKTI